MCKRWTRHDRPNRDKLIRLSENGKKSWSRFVPSDRRKCMVRGPLIYSTKVQSRETGNVVRECTDWLQPQVYPEAPIRADTAIIQLPEFVLFIDSRNGSCCIIPYVQKLVPEDVSQRIHGKYFMSHCGWKVRMQLLSSDWRTWSGWRNSKSSQFCLTLLQKAIESSDSKCELKHQCERWVLLSSAAPEEMMRKGSKSIEIKYI